jgi:hypothetical protein
MLAEEAGVKATWREFNASLWIVAFGVEKDLEKVVAKPFELMENREKLVRGFSDQIPVWEKRAATLRNLLERTKDNDHE